MCRTLIRPDKKKKKKKKKTQVLATAAAEAPGTLSISRSPMTGALKTKQKYYITINVFLNDTDAHKYLELILFFYLHVTFSTPVINKD